MTDFEHPNLLVKEVLLRPAERAKTALVEMQSRLSASEYDDLICQGLFVLAVSHVETMITDTLKYYLCALPDKIDKRTLQVTKQELLAHPYDLIEVQVEKQLWSLGYKPIQDIVEFLCDTLSLDADAAALAAPLAELKATRNVLLHNSLVANGTYLAAAGAARRVSKAGDKLTVDGKYLSTSLDTLVAFVETIARLTTTKYAAYSRLAAIKRLWQFTFKSQVMPFEDFWVIEENNDCLRFWQKGKYESNISSTEKTLLGIWRATFSGTSPEFTAFSMYPFDEDNQQKVLFLLSAFRHFSIQPPLTFRPNKTPGHVPSKAAADGDH